MLAFILLFGGGLFLGWRWTNRSQPTSPYGGSLHRGDQLTYPAVVQVYRFWEKEDPRGERPLDLSRAVVCKGTGRIFPDSLNQWDEMQIRRDFLQRFHSLPWVSWGSLTEQEQSKIRSRHSSLSGFQTENSSPMESPNHLDPSFTSLKPGPLYVDRKEGWLLGWKCVPGTELEILVLQAPSGSLP